jgi:hypothetical protein
VNKLAREVVGHARGGLRTTYEKTLHSMKCGQKKLRGIQLYEGARRITMLENNPSQDILCHKVGTS